MCSTMAPRWKHPQDELQVGSMKVKSGEAPSRSWLSRLSSLAPLQRYGLFGPELKLPVLVLLGFR